MSELTVHILPVHAREKLVAIQNDEQEAITAAIARARAPFQQARQSYLEGYCDAAGIDLDSKTHDWRLTEDNSQLEPVEKPKPNRAERRHRKKAS